MMKRWLCGLAVMAVLLVLGSGNAMAGASIGGGVNYWTSLDDIDVDDVDEEGFGYVASLQFKQDTVGLGLDLELMPDRFGEDTYAPQAYVIIGGLVYAGAGVGWLYADSEFADDPFYSLRAGVNLPLTKALHVDVYGQYRFESENEIDDIDTDTIYLGAALRLML